MQNMTDVRRRPLALVLNVEPSKSGECMIVTVDGSAAKRFRAPDRVNVKGRTGTPAVVCGRNGDDTLFLSAPEGFTLAAGDVLALASVSLNGFRLTVAAVEPGQNTPTRVAGPGSIFVTSEDTPHAAMAGDRVKVKGTDGPTARVVTWDSASLGPSTLVLDAPAGFALGSGDVLLQVEE